MAKGKKQQGYTDPLGSVFDFIFTSPKKKPVKTKPRKIKPGDANQMLARGLAEIAARPANYIGSAVLGPGNEMANSITLVDIKHGTLDTFDNDLRRGKSNEEARLRIRGGELGVFLKDPNKYIDTIFDNAAAERKFGTYLNMGRGLDTALLSVWAKKQGMSTGDAAKVGFAASNLMGPDQLNEARKSMVQNVVLSRLSDKTIGSATAQSTLKLLEKQIGVSIKSKEELTNVLKQVPALASRGDFNGIVDQIYTNYTEQSKKFSVKSPYYTDGMLNRYGYISEMSANYYNKASILDANDPKQAEEQRKLLQAHQAMNTILRMKGPGFSTRNFDRWSGEFGSYLKEYKGVIREIRTKHAGNPTLLAKATTMEGLVKSIEDELRDGATRLQNRRVSNWNIFSTLEKTDNFNEFRPILEKDIDIEITRNEYLKALETDPSKQKFYDNLIDTLNQRRRGLLTAPGLDWRLRIADTLSIYRSATGTLLGPGLAGSIAAGVFFFKDDYVAPGNMGAHLIGSFDSKANYGKAWNNVFVIPKDDISSGYASLANLYYLTPGSIVKTFFWNGEGFAKGLYDYRSSLINSQITDENIELIKSIVKELLDSDEVLKNSRILGNPNEYTKAQLVRLLPVLHHYLEPKKDKLGPLWTTFDSIFTKDKKSLWSRALHTFGAPYKLFARFNDFLNNNKVRKWIDSALREKIFNKILPKAIVSKMASGLALRQAISAVIYDAMAALGASLGPLGLVASTLLTFVAEGLVDKALKPLWKMIMGLLWFLFIFLFFFIGIFAIGIFNLMNPKPFQHVVPTDALECVEDNPFLNVYKDDPVYAGGNYGNAPANSTCPILSSSMVCTQGDGPGSSSYHQQRHSLDIGTRSLDNPVWYAPTDGRVGNYSAVNYCSDGKDYGGALSFFDSEGNEYIILHAKALATGAVKKGQPVAIAQFDLQTSYCWTGPHFHLDVKHKGSFVDDTESWYRNELKCNIMSYDPTCHGK